MEICKQLLESVRSPSRIPESRIQARGFLVVSVADVRDIYVVLWFPCYYRRFSENQMGYMSN